MPLRDPKPVIPAKAGIPLPSISPSRLEKRHLRFRWNDKGLRL